LEIWDAYSKEGALLGYELNRGEEIVYGVYHIVSEIILRHFDGEFLLMQRDFNKKVYPGKYEVTASGNALQGETPFECAIRELKEETGIDGKNHIFIGKRLEYETNGIHHLFICETDCDKQAIQLQKGETISYQWLKLVDLIKIIDTDLYINIGKKYIKEYLMKLL
jgi:8-oxo-dGTP pyrophosphatase MutT (NUDIX family)